MFGNSCCISPFLWFLRASSRLVWAVIKSSTEERQLAIFCCSCILGNNNGNASKMGMRNDKTVDLTAFCVNINENAVI